jgi:hypothetical protein
MENLGEQITLSIRMPAQPTDPTTRSAPPSSPQANNGSSTRSSNRPPDLAVAPMSIPRPPQCRPFRKPVRITITLSYSSFAALETMSGEQGRSMSNLAAFLLEAGLNATRSPQ